MKASNRYINFARKYRPINFSQIIGQEVLTKIINHSIISNRLAQGYLFTGIRGIGKTTFARIIAKTLNCSEAIIENSNISPCEECQNCLDFKDQRHPDIIEIDAASRTGVDDIRYVIESSEYRPLLGKYKAFIIDEVHMLSKSAFNALLKVLEEPPPHVVFIFATTEVQKIPLTIISRCQRYDLRRLTFDETLQLVAQIAQKEQLKFEENALKLVAFKSEGSARDAVRLLDQATNLYLNDFDLNISATMISQMLGSVDTRVIIDLFKYIINKDGVNALNLLNKLYQLSANLENLIEDLADFTAYLSKAKILINYHLPLYSDYNKEITDVIIGINLGKLSILWQIFSKGLNEIKTAHNQLIAMEMVIVKAIYSYSLPNPEDFVSMTSQNASNNHNSYSVKQQSTSTNIINNGIGLLAIKQEVNKSKKIANFLEFLHVNSEMDIYYFLLNSVELKKFENEVIEIACKNTNLQLKEKISALLLAWTGKKWNIIIQKQFEIITLKEQLINQAQAGEDWEIIKKYFPSANISDLLFKA